jgi:DNA helicase-2/ATP-dependent DNA helicase PcrA
MRKASLSDKVIRYGVFDTPEMEVTVVAQDIKKRALRPADCVVLARATKLLNQAASALMDAELEAYVARRKNDFNAPVVRVLINALRLANARHDRDILRRLCVAWAALVNQTLEVEDVAASAILVGGDFLRAWTDLAAANKPGHAHALIERIRTSLVDRLDFPTVVDWFLAEGVRDWKVEGDQELAEELATWQELHGELVREYGHLNLTLSIYLQGLDLAPKTARPGPNAVRCMTVHGAKGLEFKHVYLIGMAQEVFPSFQAVRKGPHSPEVEEERRNCFVAITRVQETLTLTRAQEYYGYPKEPSRFLSEMGFGEAE